LDTTSGEFIQLRSVSYNRTRRREKKDKVYFALLFMQALE